ncbi:hypothetical protein WJX81_003469 [Elliptochloris bilobata]|uniref:RING-type E3 ubiquitin transferase n=1 Tax=Elliptochloris bilobata TaxID=381761 RepID=A0AAW1QWK8_9CHLO
MAWGGACAWGKGAAISYVAPLKEGEEECVICFERAVQVKFRPCKHGACFTCVDKLRAANIFKADAGVKCPFCRQFVQGYDTLAGDAAAAPSLQDANRAARAAAAARDIGSRQPQQEPPPAAAQQLADWECSHCRNVNFRGRQRCNKCQRPVLHNREVPVSSGPDVLKCTPAEVLEMAQARHHPGLVRAFAEAGCQIGAGVSAGHTGGSVEAAGAAVAKRGQARLLHVARQLAEGGHVAGLATHAQGNYVLQNLLDALDKLRTAAATLRARGGAAEPELAKAEADGSDAFCVIVEGVSHALPAAALHPQGFFVTNRALELCEPADALPLAPGLVAIAPELATDPRGVHHLSKLTELLARLAGGAGPGAARGCELCAELCAALVAKGDATVARQGHHFFAGSAMVEAAGAALPAEAGAKVLDVLARSAPALSETKSGANTLALILSLEPLDAEAREVVCVLACTIAASLQGGLCNLMLRGWEPPLALLGHELVGKLLARLSSEREAAWVVALASELAMSAGAFTHNSAALATLAACLALPALPQEDLHRLAQGLGGWAGAQAAKQSLPEPHVRPAQGEGPAGGLPPQPPLPPASPARPAGRPPVPLGVQPFQPPVPVSTPMLLGMPFHFPPTLPTPAPAPAQAPAPPWPPPPPPVPVWAGGRPSGGAAAGAAWSCKACTYKHEGREAGYLSCAACGTLRAAQPAAAAQGLPGRSRPPEEDIDLARRAVRVDVPELLDEDVCSICLEEYSDSDPAVLTCCKHCYHLQCVMQWAQRSRECPMCFRALQLQDTALNELLPFGEFVPPERRGGGGGGAAHFLVDAWELERLLQRLSATAPYGRAPDRGVSRERRERRHRHRALAAPGAYAEPVGGSPASGSHEEPRAVPRAINYGARTPAGARGGGGPGRAGPSPSGNPGRSASDGPTEDAFPASWPPHTARGRLQGNEEPRSPRAGVLGAHLGGNLGESLRSRWQAL